MKKRIMIFLTFLVMFAGTFIFLDDVSAASPYLNYSSYSINGYYSVELNLENNSEKVKWSSSNKKVAKVNSKGVVSSVANGQCKIIAKVGKKKYICHLTVKGIKSYKEFTSTTLDITRLKIDVSGIIYDHEGNAVIQAAKKNTFDLKLYNVPEKRTKKGKVRWSSSNKEVVKVRKGKVIPLKSGSATIHAKVNGNKYKCKVFVTDLAKTVANKTLGDVNSVAEQIDTQNNIYKSLKLINDARIEEKVAPLKLDQTLNNVAKIRVMEILPMDMSQTDKTGLSVKTDDNFRHTRLNNTTFSTAYLDGGFKLDGTYRTAENLAHTSSRVGVLKNASLSTFHNFFASEGHRNNILCKEFHSIGIGYYKAKKFENEFGNVYVDTFWTQVYYGN